MRQVNAGAPFCGDDPKEEYIFLYLSDSKLTPRWFCKGMLDQLGVESKFYRGDAKRQLQKEVEIIRGVQGRKVVCILDEAHLLEKETIEEFRFLLNYKFDSMSPMALVLVGQSRQDIFTDKVMDEIFRESTGIPRRINRICNGCLMYASQQGKRLTDEHQVRFVLEH
uniref:ATP-binding protein n=1 Tax=Enterocloster clostridioformis TaxID=1531 RepID=UPI001F4273A7|nr:ATP-binding protein [Enterocloster clostridioformis]